MALAETPVQLRGMLLRHGLLMVAAGAIPGIAGAQLTGRFLESLMDGAKAIGLVNVFELCFCSSLLVGSASIWSATRHIARLDITSILRSEPDTRRPTRAKSKTKLEDVTRPIGFAHPSDFEEAPVSCAPAIPGNGSGRDHHNPCRKSHAAKLDGRSAEGHAYTQFPSSLDDEI